MRLEKLCKEICDLLYPPDDKCIFCGSSNDLIKPYYICNECWGALPFVKPPTCKLCGKPLLDNGSKLCHECANHKRWFRRAGAVLEYMPSVHDAIYRYKYKGHKEMAEPFGLLMANTFKALPWHADIDALIAVPLYPGKLSQRGYNQAALLAKNMSVELELPIFDAVCRCKDTAAQAKLSGYKRYKNVDGAFVLKNAKVIKDLNVLIIDDIFTTGATADACAKVLIEGGARAAYVFTLATAIFE